MKSSDFLSWRKVVGQGPGEYAGVVGEGDGVTFAYLESLQGPAVDLYCFGCTVRWGGDILNGEGGAGEADGCSLGLYVPDLPSAESGGGPCPWGAPQVVPL